MRLLQNICGPITSIVSSRNPAAFGLHVGAYVPTCDVPPFLAVRAAPHRSHHAMPSPPVLRLSQALYSNVPSPARAPPAARSSSRKREHRQVASASGCAQNETATPSVRLLLPRAFDVADRAYHARQQCPEAAAAAVGEEVQETKFGVVACPCCSDGGSAIEKRRLPLIAAGGIACDRKNVLAEEEAGASSSSSSSRSCAASACPTPGCDSQQQLLASAATMVGRVGGSAEMVVVESVLGFSALHSLLERSLATARPRDCNDLSGLSGGAAGAADGCDGEVNGARAGGEGSNPGVAVAVGRLVGWLRTAKASTGYEENDDVSYQHQIFSTSSRSSTRITGTSDKLGVGLVGKGGDAVGSNADGGGRAFPATGRLKGGPCEAAAAAVTAITNTSSTDDLRYQVTGRCEVGTEWTAFTLEPAASKQAQGEARGDSLSGMQFGAGAGSGGGGGNGDADACWTGRALEIQLICHPLVTMVPDIRWCLRLIGQAKATAGLMNANAKLSTLGGGYFLTRQVGQAITLARTQSEVAMALGDTQLAGKCRINEAYNYIWMGQYIEARRIIRTQVLASRAVNDEELENVATIASRFLRRSKKANRRLMENQIAGGGGGGGSDGGGGDGGSGGDGLGGGDGDGGDDCQKWIRQQIDVKTDEWHRVRALPMYCSSSSGRVSPAGVWGADTSRVRQELM